MFVILAEREDSKKEKNIVRFSCGRRVKVTFVSVESLFSTS